MHEIDQATAAWFHGVLPLLDVNKICTKSPHDFGRQLLQSIGSLDSWHQGQDHEITSAQDLRTAVAQRFEVFKEAEEGARLVGAIELELGETGMLLKIRNC